MPYDSILLLLSMSNDCSEPLITLNKKPPVPNKGTRGYSRVATQIAPLLMGPLDRGIKATNLLALRQSLRKWKDHAIHQFSPTTDSL